MAFISFTKVFYKMSEQKSFESFLRLKKVGMDEFKQSKTNLFPK
jgi:hypothetical protein